MSSLTLQNVSIAFGSRPILQGASLTVTEKSRIALCGANGSGKSTLFRLVTGEVEPDAGQVLVERNTRLAYLPQSGIALAEGTVLAEVEKAYGHIIPMLEECRELEARLGQVTEETPEGPEMVERHHLLQERILRSEYYNREGEIARVLQGLGFASGDTARPVTTFSGGWQMRIALARVLLEKPDILLLDEPTNYLDLEARNWLESFLLTFPGGFIIVSHDRFFLDETVTQVLEIYQRQLTSYKGNYSQYEARRAIDLRNTIEAYKKQEEEIERLETFIKRFQYNSSKAKLVQSRVKALERMERIEKPPGWQQINFSFPGAPHSGQITLSLEEVGKSYGEHCILEDVNLELMRGEKLVLVGPNGAGKSTLMKIIAGELAVDTGLVKYGKDVELGFFSQDEIDCYTSDGTVLEELENSAPVELIPRLRSLLGAFLFSGDDIFKPYAVLSGGEKNRIALLKLLLHPANMLLLDEPTNHLDMVSKEILLTALQGYTGSLVFVSHDRYFIEKLATRVLEVSPDSGVVRLYPGDYAYYLWKKEQQDANISVKDIDQAQKIGKIERLEKNDSQLSREAEKRKKGQLNRLKNDEKKILNEMENLEQDYHQLQTAMAMEENYLDGQKMKEIKEKMVSNRTQNDLLLEKWEEIEEQRAELENE